MVTRYPTGNALIDQLVEFAAERLPAIHKPDMDRRASLAEEWWLESMADCPCPLKRGWSFIYRFARDRAVESSRASDGAAELLAHQLTELLPALFANASQLITEQREGRHGQGYRTKAKDGSPVSSHRGAGAARGVPLCRACPKACPGDRDDADPPADHG